ncbi:VIT1/CCC1 transporter family protein [Candidatus Pacearchaeota archaeon]|nr:VIT1/CCC1 transporter family protein [Candidatus Pacearchaeota archaeon]
MKKETRKYLGSIVLGLNDALIELTGALAGLTFALQNTKVIAVAGLITGSAAAMSMAASEYLSTKTDSYQKNYKLKPKIAAWYTGLAYIITVLLLISPYLIFSSVYLSLITTLIISVIIILIFSYFSQNKKESWKHKFFEMLIISLSIAAISFGIGFFLRSMIGIEV